jgi:hypothetical protein
MFAISSSRFFDLIISRPPSRNIFPQNFILNIAHTVVVLFHNKQINIFHYISFVITFNISSWRVMMCTVFPAALASSRCRMCYLKDFLMFFIFGTTAMRLFTLLLNVRYWQLIIILVRAAGLLPAI